MTGIHARWFADPGTLRIVVAVTFALALAIRVLARILLRHLLRINRRKRSFRYRIPLQPARAHLGGSRGAIATVPSVAVRPPLREASMARRPQDDAPAMADLDRP